MVVGIGALIEGMVMAAEGETEEDHIAVPEANSEETRKGVEAGTAVEEAARMEDRHALTMAEAGVEAGVEAEVEAEDQHKKDKAGKRGQATSRRRLQLGREMIMLVSRRELEVIR